MKVVEYTDAEKEKFRIGSDPKVDELTKRVGKISVEEQVEKELREYFSESHTLAEEVKEVTRKEAKYELSHLQILTLLLHVLMKGDYPTVIRARDPFFRFVRSHYFHLPHTLSRLGR